MSADIQPISAADAPGPGEAETVAVHFMLPKWVAREAGLDEGALDETGREALALELFRRGLLNRPDLGRMLGLDRFETSAFLKRHRLFDDPSHQDVDAEIEAARKQLDRAGR